MAQVGLDRTDSTLATEQPRIETERILSNERAPDIRQVEPQADIGFTGEPGVMVGAIRVEGSEMLDQQRLMDALTPFLGRELGTDQMRDVLTTISRIAREQGFVFANSKIPEQTMSAGVLRVLLDTGTIDEIALVGRNSDTVLAILAPLVGGPALELEVERRLLLANDLPGIDIGTVEYVNRDGKHVLVVEVFDGEDTARFRLDNRGIATVGPVRALLGYDFNGLFGEERVSLGFQVQNTPFAPEELQAASARIRYIFDNAGTEVSLATSYSRTRPGARLSVLDLEGDGFDVGLRLRHPLMRSRDASLWLNGSLDYYATNQDALETLIRRDRIVLAGLSVNGYAPFAGGRLYAGFGVSHTLDILGATQVGDILASRPGAGPGATIFSGWGGWRGKLVGPFSADLWLAGQASTDPLFAISQLAIGGSRYGRGYDFAERTGDGGLLGSAELRYALIDKDRGVVDWAQLYGFVDGGSVHNLDNDLGNGDLFSAGFGTRFGLFGKTRFELEAAFPIDEPRFEAGDKDVRVSASISAEM